MKYFPFSEIIVQFYEIGSLCIKFQYFDKLEFGDKLNGS